MKQIIKLSIVAALLILAASCQKVMADGPVLTQTRDHSSFTSISTSISAIVTYTQSADYRVEINAQQAVLDNIRSEVANGELRFYYPHGVNIGRHETIRINISAPAVSGFSMNGSGELRCEKLQLTDKSVRIKISGSGSVNFSEMTAASLEADISGSGKMTVADGSVQKETCTISGSGDIDFKDLDADDVTTRTSGSGTIYTAAAKTLDVRISGSGKVYYRGTPKITTSISGSGKLQPY